MSNKIPDGITLEILLKAIELLDKGEQHAFFESTGYDVVHEGRHYSPKAMIGVAAKIATGLEMNPKDFSGGTASKCHRILEQHGFKIESKEKPYDIGAWLFQGNPNRFDIDDYLSRYSYIYWRTPKLKSSISVGDKCVIWRAGSNSGVIAIGRIAEVPCKMDDVLFPECLGEDLWRESSDSPDTINVGIQLDDVRLDEEEGFVPRNVLATHPIFGSATIIRSPQGTVFRLGKEQASALFQIWGALLDWQPTSIPEAMEGALRLRQHFARERSRTLIQKKKVEFSKANQDRVYCEICGFDFSKYYPKSLGTGFIEVHHLSPLFASSLPKKTTLGDLLLVCSNCHRMVHRTKDVESNLVLLRQHFSR